MHPIGTYAKNSRRNQHYRSLMYYTKTYNEAQHLWNDIESFLLLWYSGSCPQAVELETDVESCRDLDWLQDRPCVTP